MSKRDLSHKNQGLLVIVVSFILLLIHSCEQKAQKIAPLPPSVEVVSVVQRDVPIYSEYIGTTDGFVNAVIRAQVQGYLIKQNYKEGDIVKKGRVLFEIDPRPFMAILEQAEGQFFF